MNWWVETYLGRIRLECVDIVGDQCIFRGTNLGTVERIFRARTQS